MADTICKNCSHRDTCAEAQRFSTDIVESCDYFDREGVDLENFYSLVFDNKRGTFSVHMARAIYQEEAHARILEEYGHAGEVQTFSAGQFWQLFSAIDGALTHWEEVDREEGYTCDECAEEGHNCPAEFVIYNTADRDGGPSQYLCRKHLDKLENTEF